MSEPMRISPRYNVENWKALNFSTEKSWRKAIEIFEDRIRGRFLNVIDAIEKHTHAGFAVLALDCLLIETLQQFREGKASTPPRMSEKYFVNFLTTTSFGDYFDDRTAKMFYDQIRNGIFHQAEVKECSRVLKREGIQLVSTTNDGKGLIINRKLFHGQLVDEFEKYLSRLQDPLNEDLRTKFKKKMDYICRITIGD